MVRAYGLDRVVYMPADISASALEEAAVAVRAALPGLCVRPLLGTYATCIQTARRELQGARTTLLFLGSTLGNFDDAAAVSFLRSLAAVMRPRDRLLVGVDTPHKPAAVIERAYNDEDGVTSAFNLNILAHVNRVAGTDFDISTFEHRARYDEATSTICSAVVSKIDQTVRANGKVIMALRAGEAIRTEVSRKFSREAVETLFAAASLAPARAWEGDQRSHLMVRTRIQFGFHRAGKKAKLRGKSLDGGRC